MCLSCFQGSRPNIIVGTFMVIYYNLQTPKITDWLHTEGFMIVSDVLCGEMYWS